MKRTINLTTDGQLYEEVIDCENGIDMVSAISNESPNELINKPTTITKQPINNDKITNFKFSIVAGACVRKGIIAAIREYCFIHDIELKVGEIKGFFETTYLLNSKAEYRKIKQFNEWLEEIKDLNS